MKKYMKNKDFIPEKFYNIKDFYTKKSEKRIVGLFVVINIFLLPFTFGNILGVKEKPVETLENIKNINQNAVDINELNIWIENIINDDIEEANITNGNGELVVDNFNKIDKLSCNDLIKINDINLNESSKYKLGVSLNE